MNVVEAEGQTIEEAVAAALRQLGVERQQAEIEILAQSTKGFLGIGGKKARIRASLRKSLTVSESAPDRKPTASAASGREGNDRKGGKDEKDRPASSTPRGRTATRTPRTPTTPRREPRVSQEPQEIQAPSASMREAAREAVPEVRREQRAQSELPPPELIEHACDVLRNILDQMGIEAPVSSSIRDEEVVINLEDTTGGTGGLLIGPKGETLDAFEYLLNRMVSRGEENEARLVLDSSGYRERRQQNLESLALRLGERAKRRRTTVTLSPLNPRDRRTVHLTLEGDPLVTTQSMGRGYLRRLSIVPEGGSRQERGRDRNAA